MYSHIPILEYKFLLNSLSDSSLHWTGRALDLAGTRLVSPMGFVSDLFASWPVTIKFYKLMYVSTSLVLIS